MASKENTGKADAMTPYQKMRALDVSQYIEKKGKFSYLSWAWAVDQMFIADPEAKFDFPARETFQDGTVMVYCDVTMFGKTRRAYLPCLDHQNKPIAHPNAMQINTAMQRCLVKGIALHGLGLYIYAGEDLPETTKQDKDSAEEVKKFQRDFLYDLTQKHDEFDVTAMLENLDNMSLPETVLGQLQDAAESRQLQIRNGVEAYPAKWGFINVAEAIAFMTMAGEKIDKSTDVTELGQWMLENDHKLKALDTMLSAEKYQNADGTPYQRTIKKYSQRIPQLQPRAAE